MLLCHVSRQSIKVGDILRLRLRRRWAAPVPSPAPITQVLGRYVAQVTGGYGRGLGQIDKSGIPRDPGGPLSSSCPLVSEGCQPHVCTSTIWVLLLGLTVHGGWRTMKRIGSSLHGNHLIMMHGSLLLCGWSTASLEAEAFPPRSWWRFVFTLKIDIVQRC